MSTSSSKDLPDQLPSINTLSNFNVHYHNITNDTQLLETINSCRSTTHHHHSRLLYFLTDPSFLQRYSTVLSTTPITTATGALFQPPIAPSYNSLFMNTGSSTSNDTGGYKAFSMASSPTADMSHMASIEAKLSPAKITSTAMNPSASRNDYTSKQLHQQQLYNNYYNPSSLTATSANMHLNQHYNSGINTQTHGSQTSNFLNNSVPQPLLPPPQPLITHQPIAVAAVDDCCNECCPAIHPEEANRKRYPQPATATTATLIPCTLNHDEEPIEESIVLPSIKGRKRSLPDSTDALSLSNKKWRKVDPDNKKGNGRKDQQVAKPTSVTVTGSNKKWNAANNDHSARCQWSSCLASFDSLEDLPVHLFNEHLNNLPNGKYVASNTPTTAATTTAPATTISSHSSNSSSSGSETSSLSLTAAEEEYLLNCSWASCTEKFNVTESFIDHLYKQHLHSLRQQQQQQQQQQIQVQTLMPTSVKEKQYQCHWINCQQTLNHLESLLNHVLEVHILGQKNEYYCRWSSCDRIGRPFTQRQKLIRHLQTTHLGFKPFQCDICQKGFSEARLLMQHKRVHTGEKPFSCDQCDKKFSVASALTIHKRTLHSGEKPFICKYCKKKFPESSNLTKHMRVHTGEKPFKCTICDIAFARPDQRTRHMKTHDKDRKK